MVGFSVGGGTLGRRPSEKSEFSAPTFEELLVSHPFPESAKEYAVVDGKHLYVLRGRQGTPVIQSWRAEMARAGFPVEVTECDMEVLDQVRQTTSHAFEANLSAIRQVRRIVAQAVAEKASDIHFSLHGEDGKGYLSVQFRVRGTVEDRLQFPYSEGSQMIRAMFQGMAAVTDAAFRETEDQHAVIVNPALLRTDSGEDLGLSGIRLARAPLYDGMNLAARLLYRLEKPREDADLLAQLGYSGRQRRILYRLARQTMGINPFTGPTGSGKSTTLAQMIHSILRMRHGARIITIEDPVEYVFDSDFVWQYRIANANTDEEKNRAFSGKLKTALRQDPDIIMVGEIRGLEVAKEAINASITGHQVWTTLHVSDPFMIIQRLVAMGVDGFYLQDPKMLSSLIAQRLVKTLCPHCAIPVDDRLALEQGVDPEDWAKLKTWATPDFPMDGVRLKGPGCAHCRGTGIAGRTVVSQVIPTDEELLITMVNEGPMPARRKYLANPDAELPMEAHAVLKILSGKTDPRFVAEMLGPIEERPRDLRAFTLEDL
ncbi:GspE/PulE family protein [Acidithiobacillus caldus]|uniref:GspE/PulE family protein n=1 Tax=Acidithiobacillus caldus TaxID=33059 RepID=UPI001D0310B0|nr:ATPase, T2SS/T4P/T4SS family [Acidithiobacillus caldus]